MNPKRKFFGRFSWAGAFIFWVIFVGMIISCSVSDGETAVPTHAHDNQSTTNGVYYVNQNHPSANDANPGSEALPWLTIQHAADTLQAGDTVYVRAGTYNEMVEPANSGSAGIPIVYAAYPDDTV
ncbi:MAG: hypothetical protein GY803_00705, partial [Chloroflexi bacterium]|nr:hypothetical protein [Chloroflexota bacterium]